jgi:hypothetical protein
MVMSQVVSALLGFGSRKPEPRQEQERREIAGHLAEAFAWEVCCLPQNPDDWLDVRVTLDWDYDWLPLTVHGRYVPVDPVDEYAERDGIPLVFELMEYVEGKATYTVGRES